MLPTFLTIAMALYTAWAIGSNDETIAPVVSGRSLGVNKAIIIGSVFGIIGAIILGESVQKYIGSGILVEPISAESSLIALFSSSTWLAIVSSRGYSVSTTHSTFSALVGYGLASFISNDVDWIKAELVIEGWLISIPIGFLGGYLLTKMILHIKNRRSKDKERFEKNFSKLLILSTFALQFSRWGNDVGNAAGMLYTIFDPFFSRLICALAMAIGLFVLGRIVVGSVGIQMVRLQPSVAFVAQIVSTSIILPFVYIGVPLSGTHVLISSMIGSGRAAKVKVNMRIVKKFGIAWILSFIVPGIIAATIVSMARLF
jgi:PiT family inorganic phosphate transporter